MEEVDAVTFSMRKIFNTQSNGISLKLLLKEVKTETKFLEEEVYSLVKTRLRTMQDAEEIVEIPCYLCINTAEMSLDDFTLCEKLEKVISLEIMNSRPTGISIYALKAVVSSKTGIYSNALFDIIKDYASFLQAIGDVEVISGFVSANYVVDELDAEIKENNSILHPLPNRTSREIWNLIIKHSFGVSKSKLAVEYSVVQTISVEYANQSIEEVIPSMLSSGHISITECLSTTGSLIKNIPRNTLFHKFNHLVVQILRKSEMTAEQLQHEFLAESFGDSNGYKKLALKCIECLKEDGFINKEIAYIARKTNYSYSLTKAKKRTQENEDGKHGKKCRTVKKTRKKK